jgi:hypothetical protein
MVLTVSPRRLATVVVVVVVLVAVRTAGLGLWLVALLLGPVVMGAR